MDWREGHDLILCAMKKERERKYWELWLVMYPHMTKDNFISFEEFKKNHEQPQIISIKPASTILAEAEAIKHLIEGR